MIVALLGANGRVGKTLLSLLQDFKVHALTRSELDIKDRSQVLEALNLIRPSFIVNCAAFTNVDKAEVAKEECFRVNAEFVGWLVDWAETNKANLIHFSSDYVFNGKSRNPYKESDFCDPINFYGFSKLASEKLCLSYEKSLVIRTSYLFSHNTNNLITILLEKLRNGDKLKIVKDQVISITNIFELSSFVVTCMKKCVSGIFHFANYGEVNLEELVSELGQFIGKKIMYDLVLQEELARPAKRPLYSALDCSKSSYLFKPMDWQTSLKYTLEKVT
jgi:dTDP-4-dehydrorhamnose reductase